MTVLFLHVVAPSPRPLSITALAPLVASRQGELAFRQMSATRYPQWSASEIKQTFLSTNLACLLTFEQQAAGPTTRLLVTGYAPRPRRARKGLSQNMTQVCTIPINHRFFHGRTQRPNVNFFQRAPVVPHRH